MAYNTGNPIGSTDPRDLVDNAENFDKAVNAEAQDSWTDRLGRPRKTWDAIEREAAELTQVATEQADRAEQEADRAEQEADRAEAAVDIAFVNAAVYESIADGLAATTDGDQFSVVEDDEIIRYLNDDGVAVELARYPSGSLFSSDTPVGYVWSVIDGDGGAAIGIEEDGTFVAARAKPHELVVGKTEVSDIKTAGYVWSVQDRDGNIAAGVRADGTFEAAKVLDHSASDVSPVDRHGGVYPAQLTFIATQGQSLAGGSDGAITTVQEYDNIGFRAMSVNPTTVYPLITSETATTQSGGGTENPMYGTAGFIKELIEKENGITWEKNDFQLLSCCNGSSGAPIDEINKGGSRGMYEAAISQLTAGKALADSSRRSYMFGAVTWTHGGSDASMPKDTYKSKLIQLANDFNNDGKAVTGQSQDILFICYQRCGTSTLNTVTPALLEASEEVSFIYLATPTYFMDHYDGTHITALSSKWLGGYYGLVYKRVRIDQKPWEPLKPAHHSVIGNVIDLFFNKEGLVFDTTIMPAQTNYGFTVADGSNSPVSISSIEIVKPNRVRITCASAPQPGWRVRYGHISVVGKSPYSGPGGNLRDSAGDRLVYDAIGKPMHNWCVIFDRLI